MRAGERRQAILDYLRHSSRPVSAGFLAERYNIRRSLPEPFRQGPFLNHFFFQAIFKLLSDNSYNFLNPQHIRLQLQNMYLHPFIFHLH